ncbi:MAG: DUF4169 family protein [Sneathiellaceae bacterium]
MGDLVNLKRHRKKLARRDAAVQAETNRTRFGRSKAARQQAASEIARQARGLDGKRMDAGEQAAAADQPRRQDESESEES